jgi:hypothetical protein
LIHVTYMNENTGVLFSNVNLILRWREQIAVVSAEYSDNQIGDGVRWGFHVYNIAENYLWCKSFFRNIF